MDNIQTYYDSTSPDSAFKSIRVSATGIPQMYTLLAGVHVPHSVSVWKHDCECFNKAATYCQTCSLKSTSIRDNFITCKND